MENSALVLVGSTAVLFSASEQRSETTHPNPPHLTSTTLPSLGSPLDLIPLLSGRWQKRWFETNGNFLTYYKSKKMTKLLAALNLPQVGDIKGIEEGKDLEAVEVNDGSFFTIEVG